MGKQLRWGIFGTGHVSSEFVDSGLSYANLEEHKFYGVAARKLEDAKSFAEKHGIEKAFNSYEDLAGDPNIDIVYVGTVTSTHFRLGKIALESGKHVLMESRFCGSVSETKELLELAKQKNLFIMSSAWMRFLPSWEELRRELKSNLIGDVKQVLLTFGFDLTHPELNRIKEKRGESHLDIGITCVEFAGFVFNGEKPIKVVSTGHLNSDGDDDSTSTTLLYEGGRTATFLTHNLVKLPNDAFVIGTKGQITIHDFWCSTKITTSEGTTELPLPETTTTFPRGMNGLFFQCKEVYRCIQSGLIESPVMSHAEILIHAQIHESMRKQIGIRSPHNDQ